MVAVLAPPLEVLHRAGQAPEWRRRREEASNIPWLKPAGRPGHARLAALPRPTTAGEKRDGTVLIGEHDPAFARALAGAFERRGAGTRLAGDGWQVLVAIEQRFPELLVLDLDLPVISTFRLVHLLRRDQATRHIPIVVVSPVSFAEAEELAREGVEAFVQRPVAAERVVAEAYRVLALHHARLERSA
jgi:CheY-like chemotaxis protein